MKKRIYGIIAVILATVLTVGCGKTANNTQDNTGNENKTDVAENTENATIEQDITYENAYGYFIPVGDKIIYRHYSSDAMDSSALYAKYLSYNVAGTGSYICVYDLKTGKAERLFDDAGYGKIALVNNRLYMTKNVNDGNTLFYSTDLNGSDYLEIGSGTVEDVDIENGHFLLCNSSSEYDSQTGDVEYAAKLSVYDGGELIREQALDGQNIYCTGKLFGDYAVYHTYKSPDDSDDFSENLLYSISIKDKEEPVLLGVLPKEENLGEGSEFEDQWKCLGDKVYGLYCTYAGTGHFFQNGSVISVKPGTANSVTVEEAASTETFETPEYVLSSDGKITIVDTCSGDISIGANGICEALADNDATTILNYNDLPCPSEYNNDDFYTNVEVCEKVGDKLFLLYNKSVYSEAASVGWREGYNHYYSGYVVADYKPGVLSNITEFDSQNFMSIDDMWKTADVSPIFVETSKYAYYESDEVDGSDQYKRFYVRAGSIDVAEKGYDELKSSLAAFNSDLKKEAEAVYQENHDGCMEMLSESDYFDCLDCEYTISVNRADNKILSFEVDQYSDFGGFHPNICTFSRNYISKTGKEITLDELVSDKEAFSNDIISKLKSDQYYSENLTEDYWEDAVREVVNSSNLTFTILEDRIRVHFDAYEIACYAAGSFDVYIDSIGVDYVNQDYFDVNFAECGDFAQPLDEYRTYYLDVNNDGQVDSLSWDKINYSDEEYMEYDEVTVCINGEETSIETWGWIDKLYLVTCSSGDSFIYLQMTSDNDYRSVGTFAIDGNSVNELEWTNGSIVSGDYFNPLNFIIVSKVDFLGTFSGYTTYYMGANGAPVEIDYEKKLMVEYDDYRRKMTSLRDIEVMVNCDASGNEVYEYQTIPAGTDFYPQSTDGESYMNCVLEDGTWVTIYTEKDDDHWERMINGYSEYDCFDNIIYAG